MHPTQRMNKKITYFHVFMYNKHFHLKNIIFKIINTLKTKKRYANLKKGLKNISIQCFQIFSSLSFPPEHTLRPSGLQSTP